MLCRIRVKTSLCIPVFSRLFSVLLLRSHLLSVFHFRIFVLLFQVTLLGSGHVELDHSTEFSTQPDYISPTYFFMFCIVFEGSARSGFFLFWSQTGTGTDYFISEILKGQTGLLITGL